MARKRFIDPSFWTDSAVAKLTYAERLFFIGCFSNADDEGRLPGSPAFLRSIIFAYDDLTIDQVRQMRDRVISLCKNLRLYRVHEDDFLAFVQWKRYQSPRYPQPSHYPAPPTDQASDIVSAPLAESLTQGCNQIGASLPQGCVNDEAMGSGRDQVRDQVGVGDQVGMGSSTEVDPPADATREERSLLHELKQIPRYPLDMTKDLGHVRTLAVDFPGLNLLEEVKRWRSWLLDHPLEKKSNPRLKFRNWCEIAARRQEEKKGRARDSPENFTPNTRRALDIARRIEEEERLIKSD